MFAYVPARGGSKRLPRKNIRALGGRPLLLHVLDQLSRVEDLSGVGVSSEDEEILRIAESHGSCETLAPRRTDLADDQTDFLTLVREDVPRFAQHFGDRELLFVTSTAALVGHEYYADAIEQFRSNPRGLTIAVTELVSSPVRALVGEPEKELVALFEDAYTRPTKDLPRAFVDAGCFYAFDLDLAIQLSSAFLELKPVRGIVLPVEIGIDLDTRADWTRLEAQYETIRGRNGR